MEIAMRASMTAGAYKQGCEGIGCVWGDPRGPLGSAALLAMALKNGGQNKAALDALAPKFGDCVLEIGCGPGMGMRAALKRVGRGGFVAGVDHSPTAVHFAAHAVHHAALAGRAVAMRSDADDLPFRDMLFDGAFAVNSFQFWPDPARALREIARVLAPGGRFVLTQRASNLDRPTNFAGAARGMERIAQATALFQAQGWNIVDERCIADGARLMAASVIAERPR
jgi:ubiquinone/menaquinone biosynthesis C-methylase UbiE